MSSVKIHEQGFDIIMTEYNLRYVLGGLTWLQAEKMHHYTLPLIQDKIFPGLEWDPIFLKSDLSRIEINQTTTEYEKVSEVFRILAGLDLPVKDDYDEDYDLYSDPYRLLELSAI